jgi:cytochrome oxidase assembly protein ShyY1
MMTSIQVRKHAKTNLPPPLVKIRTIERMLLRHATGPIPEARLIVAVICQAMADSRSSSKNERRTARNFLYGRDLDAWAALIDLDPTFVREVAIKTHYLPEAPMTTSGAVPATIAAGRTHAGLQSRTAPM